MDRLNIALARSGGIARRRAAPHARQPDCLIATLAALGGAGCADQSCPSLADPLRLAAEHSMAEGRRTAWR